MSEIPDRLNIDRKDRELYNKLDSEEILKFKDNGGTRTRKEQFIFAMAYGFKLESRKPLDSMEGFVLAKDLRPDDEALINAIAIYNTKSIEILSDQKEVFKIAEEYAHAGIILLDSKIKSTSFVSYERELEKTLHEMFQKIKL